MIHYRSEANRVDTQWRVQTYRGLVYVGITRVSPILSAYYFLVSLKFEFLLQARAAASSTATPHQAARHSRISRQAKTTSESAYSSKTATESSSAAWTASGELVG